MEKSYLDGLKQCAVNPTQLETRITEVGEVQTALAQCRELADFASRVVSQFCGSKPEASANECTTDYDPDGVLPRLSAEARRCISEMNYAMSELRRLQKAIP